MFHIFKSQQAVAQNPRLSARNANNFKAACKVLMIAKIGGRKKMRHLILHISSTKHLMIGGIF
jgi:hypothetical protein